MQSCLVSAGGPSSRDVEGSKVHYQRVQFGNEPVSERVHVMHVIRSVVDLFEEVFQLLDENALLEPLH